jgi:hypothetical protein
MTPDGRWLAGAIRPEQGKDLALLDLQIDAFRRFYGALTIPVRLGQIPRLRHHIHACLPHFLSFVAHGFLNGTSRFIHAG